MELLAFIFLVFLLLVGLKIFAVLFKTALFLISIPFQILGAVFAAFLVFLFLPVGIIFAVVALIFAPLMILGPLLPILAIVGLIYLVVK